jgi:dolichyl-phosphate-mannose--protein O-mannosyl transferase
MPQPQNFENHARFVPGFHIAAFGIFVINLLWSIYMLIHAFSPQAIVSFLLAVGFLLLFFYARIFALTVQDRVIRLEMQLRLQRILPLDLQPRIGEFQIGQLVALRFASDRELPDLARKVLDEKLEDRKAIKRLVKDWQADLLRA